VTTVGSSLRGSTIRTLEWMKNNDENFIVIRGDRPLAEGYTVNAESAWRHYAYRTATPTRTSSASTT
jgi:hypothetical protein